MWPPCAESASSVKSTPDSSPSRTVEPFSNCTSAKLFLPVAIEKPSSIGVFTDALAHSSDPGLRTVTVPSTKLSRTTRTCDSPALGEAFVPSVFDSAEETKNDNARRRTADAVAKAERR